MTKAQQERPILFNGEMVRAILNGRKTQTRRVVKNPVGDGTRESPLRTDLIKCPYGQVSDRLWVRENTYADHDTSDTVTLAKYFDDEPVLHDYDPVNDPDGEYRDSIAHWWYSRDCCPSIHMPRWASRIQLEVTNIHVERLNEITTSDCYKEGMEEWLKDEKNHPICNGKITKFTNARQGFSALWQSINGAESWKENPWVLVVEFERVDK